MVLLDNSPWLLELKESFANRPERAAGLSIPVDRISLYSSTERPLKLVSLGRGYWSHGAERTEKVGERLVLQQNVRDLMILEKPYSSAQFPSVGLRKSGARLEEQRHLEVKNLASPEWIQEAWGEKACVI